MFFKRMSGSLSSRLIIVFAILLAITLSASVFAFVVNQQLNANVPFTTTIAKCTETSCPSLVDSGKQTSSGTATSLTYQIDNVGRFVEYDYATCKNSKIFISDYSGAESPNPPPISFTFSSHKNRNATVNQITIPPSSIQENNPVQITANIKAALSYPSSLPVNPPIPTELADPYSYTTNVTFTVKNSTGAVVGSPSVVSVAPLISSNQDAPFSFTPTQQGTYIVEVKTKVTDCAADSVTATEVVSTSSPITITDAVPSSVDFSATTPRTGVEGSMTTTFQATAQGGDQPLKYTWDFGDGTVIPNSDQSTISHPYTANGNYTVTLNVTDADGSPSNPAVKQDYITVFDSAFPRVQFTPDSSVTGIEPFTVTFTEFSDASPDSITNWLWYFDDDTQLAYTAKQNTIVHTYNATNPSQAYTTSLTVTKSGGLTAEKSITVTVVDGKPAADFSISANPTEEQSVIFTDASTTPRDQIVGWSWDFGNGQTSTLQAPPTQSYTTPGTKTVNLTVTDADSSTNTTTKTVNIAAVNDAPVITASIANPLEAENFTNPITVDLTSLESDEEDGPAADGNSLVWSVSGVDTNLLSVSLNQATDVLTINSVPQASGANTLTLTLTDSGGKTATTQFTITVNPVNDDPTSTSIPNQQWDEDTVKTINLLDYFSDIEGPFQSILPVSQPANIQVTVSNFVATLTPDLNFNSDGGQTRTIQFIGIDKGQPDGVNVKTKTSNVITLTVNPVNEIFGSITTGSTINEFSTVSSSTVTDSTITNSTITNSNVTQNSNLFNSTVTQNSVVQNSTLVNVILINSTAINAVLENVTLTNAFIDPSTVKNSTITDSDIINSIVTHSTITGRSRIENMTVTSATVTDDVLQSGTITFLGETTTVPLTTLAYIKDRPPVSTQTFNGVFWLEDAPNTADLSTEFFDSDGDTLNYSASSVQNIQISISSNGVVTFIPDANFTGQRQVLFSATDPLGKSVNGNFVVNLTVLPQNDNPEITSTAVLTAIEDSAYSYDVNAFDVDEDALTFSLTTPPTGMTINPSTGLISWTPDNSQVGPNPVTVQVSDTLLTATQSFTVTVANTNDAPTTSTISPGTWLEDTSSPVLDLSQFFSDVDVGDSLNFSVVTEPSNVVVNQNNNLITFTPNANFTGLDSVKFRATDISGDSVESNLVTLNITPVNDLPVVLLTQPNGGELWNGIQQIKWNASDVDGDALTVTLLYSTDGVAWNQIQTGLSNNGQFNWNTEGLDGSAFKVNATVSDGTVSVSDISDAVFSVDNTPPSVDIVGPLSLVESTTPVEYNSTTSDNIADVDSTSFFWTFGDGTNATGPSVSHAYAQNGTFQLTLSVKDNLGNQNSSTKTVVVDDTLPVSNFTFTPAIGIQEGVTQINFSSISSGYDSPLTLFWDFGDNTNSTDPTPTKIYNQNKTYTVILVVTDADGSTNQSQQQVIVDDLGPAALFTSTPTSNIFENITQVNFTDQSSFVSDTISEYFWDFGDDTNSTEQNPIHTFVFNDTYTVTLTVTDSDGTQSTLFTQNLTVLDNSPTAEAGSNQVVDEGSLVFFDGSSSSSSPDTISTYFWDFGDGTNSTGALANRTYVNNNTYTVNLTVTDSDNSQNSDTLQVIVLDKSPSVDFTIDPVNPAEDQSITFTDNSTSAVDNKTSYSWNFGDGVENIAGVYKGTSSIDEQHAFLFSKGNPTSGTGDFWYSSGSATTGWLYTIYTLSNSVIAKYTQPALDLSSVDCTGLTYTQDTQQVNIGDIFCININNTNRYGAIKATGIENTVSFGEIPSSTGTIFFDWIYNPENSVFNIPTVDSGLNASHSYATDGTYLINLTVSDSDGSSNYTSKEVTISFVNDAPTILVATQQTKDEDFGTLSINLTNLATDEEDQSTSLMWSVSDVNTSLLSYEITPQNILNINSVGNASGTNTITLNVTDLGGLQDIAYLGIIVNPVNDPPVINQPNITMTEDIPYDVNLSSIVSDPDNTPNQINWSGTSTFPILLSIDNENKTLTITNLANETATGQFTLTAFDGQNQTSTDSIFVTITPVNDQPILNQSMPDIQFDEDKYNDTLTNLNAFFFDVDSTLTFTAVSDNPSILVNITGSSANISANPDFNGNGTITFTASDDLLNTTETISVNVTSVNDMPSIPLIGITGTNSTGFFAGTLVLSAQSTDVEDGVVTNIQFERSLNSTDGTDGTFAIVADPSLWPSEPINETDQSVWIRAKAIDSQNGESDYISQEIKIDNQVPVTSHDYDYSWKTSNFTIILTPNDFNGSGVPNNRIFYKINGVGSFVSVQSGGGQPIITDESATNYLEFYSIDRLGSTEPVNNLTNITLDKTQPSISGLVQTPSDITEDTLTSVEINATVSDLTSGLAAGYPKLSYKVSSASNFTTVNMTLLSGVFTATISILPSWDYYRGEALTYKIIARDVAGNERISEVNDTIDNINDVPTINLTGILPSPSPLAGNFSPNSLTEVIATVSDNGDLDGSSISAGSIVDVTFKVSTDGESGTFTPCSGSLISSNSTTWRHQCNNILTEGQQSEDIWLEVQAQDNNVALSNTSKLKIKIDNSPPTTVDNTTLNWVNTSFTVELTATDTNGSGVKNTVYCEYTTTPCDINNPDIANPYVGPFVISADGVTNISYRSTDNLDKGEATKAATVKVDKIKPTIHNISLADNYVRNNTEVLITVNTTDSLSGVVTVTVQNTNLTDQGNGLWEGLVALNFDGPLPASNVPLNVIVIDVAGNVETNNSEVFHIDNDPPIINSVELSDNIIQSNTTVTVTVNVTDFGPVSVFVEGSQLTLSDGLFSGPLVLPPVDGVVDVLAVDPAGNNATHNSTTFLIDDTPPTISDNATIGWQTSPFNVTLTAIDNESVVIKKITYSINGGSDVEINFTNTTNIEISQDGIYNITYYATNNVTGTTFPPASFPQTITVYLDTVNPSVSFTSGPANGSTVKGIQVINVSAYDLTSGLVNITVYANGTGIFSCAQSPCNTSWDSGPDGLHTINATATDAAGLQSVTETRTIDVDNSKPELSFNSPAEGPYNTDQIVNITVSDDHPGTISLNVDGQIVNTTTATELIYVLGEGNHTVNATAIDTVGNSNETQQTRNILVDKSAPEVTGLPINEPTYPENVQISIGTTDLIGIDKAFVNISGTLYQMDLIGGTSQNGQLLANISGLAAGNYAAQFLVNDTLGNLNNSVTINFAVSKTSPLMQLELSPLPPENTTEVFSEINSTGQLLYGEGIVELYLNGNLINSGSPVTNITNMTSLGLQNFTLNYPETQNFSTSSLNLSVNVVDTTLPIVALVSPANDTLNNITAPQDFTFTATDNFYPNLYCTLFVTNPINGDVNATNASVEIGVQTTISSTVPEGNNTWYVSCSDGSSNSGQSETRVLRTDYTAPSLVASSITGGNSAGIFSPANLGGPYTFLTVVENFSEPVRGKTVAPYSTHVYSANGTIVGNFIGPSTYSLSNSKVNWNLLKNGTLEFLDDGTYTINITVNDTAGNVATLFVGSFQVDNTPPTVNITQLNSATEGVSVTFNGSATDDIAEVDTNSFTWQFGDGNSTPAQQGIVENTYSSNGTYTVFLSASDLAGNIANTTITVNVADTIPTANFTFVPSTDILENATLVNFTITSTGYDLPLDYNWLWGDGWATSSSIQEAEHLFEKNNTYTVNLTVTDSDGSSYSTLQQVVVEDMKPTSDIFGSTQIFEGENATFNASGSTTVTDPIVAYQWTMSSDNGSSFTLLNTTASPALTIPFNSNGTFIIGVLAIDSDDSPPFPPGGDTLNIAVLDKNPTAVLTGDTVVFENRTAFFNASGSTSSPDTISSYEWDFNYNGTFVPAVNVTGPVVNHTYPSPSTPTVAVKVTDSDGSFNISTLSVLVKPSDHDLSVDSISQNKSTSTVYLFDTVNVTANISNLGNFEENITIRLKEGTTVLTTTTATIQRNTTGQLSFNWTPTIAGFHTLIVEILPVSGETNAVNNQKILQNVQVFSVKDNVDLSFVNPTQYPEASENSSSQFYVWVRVANNLTTDFNDFPVALNSDGLNINTTQDGNQQAVKVFDPLSGTRTFWWLLDSGSVATKNMTITIGNGADSVTINRTVSIV